MKRSDFIWERKLKQNVYCEELKWYQFDAELTEVIYMLTELTKKYTTLGYSKLHLDWVTYDDSISVTLRGDVMESDEEFDNRIKNQEQLLEQDQLEKKKRKNQEYNTYLRLKKKFEKTK